MNTKEKINDFRGEYRWLSNFATGGVNVYGCHFDNREAAFQGMKCISLEERSKFFTASPSEAKRLGRQVTLRPDWENVKEEVMYQVCKEFFKQHTNMWNRLLETGDAYLEEGNTWGDTYWGVCNGEGQNKLGLILMRIREECKLGAYC